MGNSSVSAGDRDSTCSVVIVGAGHAAAQAARSLRANGFDGRLIMVGAEDWLPYDRPPLSKERLTQDGPVDRLLLNPDTFYSSHKIELVLGSAATAIDRDARHVTLANGERLSYDRLVLATGSRVRRLPDSIAGAERALYLRSFAECAVIRARLANARRVVVIGAGYIGLEVAASIRKTGAAVTVIEAADRALARIASPHISQLFEAAHRAWGVTILTNAKVKAIEPDAVLIEGHPPAPADLVIAGIGGAAEDSLARGAGLLCDDGVLVDQQGRSSDPAIFAIGDVAKPVVNGARLRLESVSAAVAQGKAVAAAIMGQPAPADETPWFWSDQFDLKLQIAGVRGADDVAVVRRREDAPGLAVLHCRDNRLTCIEAVNDPRSFMMARRIIADPDARIDLDIACNGEIPFAEAFSAQARTAA
ncbi:NAD(P)/FAD-dependent oxidoreductase [Terrarubrum flagellatum]|uniref:NAD(P)/FAD-dependent oxidoreductase n=1 Tax=Terrirubrum flagellatum TaxID=2895980 RepID=UPI0031450FC3